MGKGGSVSDREGTVMSEDAPVNTGAVEVAGEFRPRTRYGRMQAKLHCWAAEILPVGSVTCSTSFMTRRFWWRVGTGVQEQGR